MVRLLSVGIGVFSSVIFVVPAVFISQYLVLKQRSFSRLVAVMIFALYLIAVFSVVGIPTAASCHIHPEFNLIPFIDIVNSPPDYIRNTVLNIILFVPLGFLVPIIWKEYRSVWTMILTGFLLSFMIEVLQIFTFRLTDVDDLISNTAGCLIGYYVGKVFSFRLLWSLPENNKGVYRKYEPVMILGLMLVIGFCFKPLVSDMIWDKVLASPIWENIRNR